MTRDEADQIAVYLSVTYGPWSDMKKAMFAQDVIDLPFEMVNQVAHEWVRTNPGNRWPGPGDLRLGVNRLIDRRQQLRLTDERRAEPPVEHGDGIRFLSRMREKIERRGRRGEGQPTSLGDIIGKDKP